MHLNYRLSFKSWGPAFAPRWCAKPSRQPWTRRGNQTCSFYRLKSTLLDCKCCLSVAKRNSCLTKRNTIKNTILDASPSEKRIPVNIQRFQRASKLIFQFFKKSQNIKVKSNFSIFAHFHNGHTSHIHIWHFPIQYKSSKILLSVFRT